MRIAMRHKAAVLSPLITVAAILALGLSAVQASDAMNEQAKKADSPAVQEIARAESRLPEFYSLYRQCQAKGIALDYPTITKTMLEQFIPLAYKDAKKGINWRAEFAAKDFHQSLDQSISLMKVYLANPKLVPMFRRYQTGKLEIDGLSFIGERIDTSGKIDRGPVFFCGYGAFGQIRKDMSRWPAYGVNVLQSAEFGIAHVLLDENKVDLQYVNEIARAFDEAAKQNVKVDLHLALHYFPDWALKKWPHLAKGSGGFIGFCIDAPEAKQVIEKYLRAVIPVFKDKPALFSFCLSNELTFFNTANCDNTKPMWVSHLSKVHGDVKTMNERYGTSYTSFGDVPIPRNESWQEPQFYDFCIFNQERVAAWHKWVADVIHEMAPNVPTYAKAMSTQINRGMVAFGVDHELYSQQLDLNGNDCYWFPSGAPGWARDPWLLNTSYDMQRSFARKPVFNSENHITPDRSTNYVPPEVFRSALWQGAIHGQGATAIWVWDRSDDPNYDFYGNVMDRPGCAEAVGQTCLDLNRFASEMTALQNVKEPVAVVYSMASLVRNEGYSRSVFATHQGLNSCGIKVDYISEKQLGQGKGLDYKMIILPHVSHLTDIAFSALLKLPKTTGIVIVGENPRKDPYNRDYSSEQVKALKDRALNVPNADPQTAHWPVFTKELRRLGALPKISVVGATTNEPVWGVEWLPAQIDGKTIINIINLRSRPVRIKVKVGDSAVSTRDLLSLGSREEVKWLRPLVPVLAEVR